MLAQINAEGEGDAEENELMFDAVAEFLAQAGDSEKAELNTLVHQVLAEQYSENGNILLAQADGELKESTNEDLDAVAEFLAQLSTEELSRMTSLVETKSQELQSLEDDDSIELSQLDSENEGFDFDDYDEDMAF